jgi:hypothetical protein
LWKETEDKLLDALAAVDDGTLLSSPERLDTIKDAVALHYARQYCLVKPLGVSLLTFPQRHARELVDDLMIQPPCFHFP